MSVDEFLTSDTGKAVVFGLVAAVVAPVVLAAASGVGRPVARAAIKSGLLLLEKGRETAAELGEVFDDLVAEAEVEIAESRNQAMHDHELDSAIQEVEEDALSERKHDPH